MWVCVCVCLCMWICVLRNRKARWALPYHPLCRKSYVSVSLSFPVSFSLSLSLPPPRHPPPLLFLSISLSRSLTHTNTHAHSHARTVCLSLFVTHANAYESVMSHMNESYHIWINHVTYKQVVSHMNESLSVFLEREWEREGKKRELLQLVVLVSIYIHVYICIFWSTPLSCQHESSLLSSLLSIGTVHPRSLCLSFSLTSPLSCPLSCQHEV